MQVNQVQTILLGLAKNRDIDRFPIMSTTTCQVKEVAFGESEGDVHSNFPQDVSYASPRLFKPQTGDDYRPHTLYG